MLRSRGRRRDCSALSPHTTEGDGTQSKNAFSPTLKSTQGVVVGLLVLAISASTPSSASEASAVALLSTMVDRVLLSVGKAADVTSQVCPFVTADELSNIYDGTVSKRGRIADAVYIRRSHQENGRVTYIVSEGKLLIFETDVQVSFSETGKDCLAFLATSSF